MAEIEGFKLVFSADKSRVEKSVTELKAELKALNKELESSKGVDAFDRLNKKIADVKTQIAGIRNYTAPAATSIGNVAKSSGGATQALTDLGRVASDAPYGFIGIANNIDPMLASFRRLVVSSGGTRVAMRALGSAMIGPAGLMLGFTVVSALVQSAILKYGSLGEAIKVLTGAKKALTEEEKAYAKAQKESLLSLETEKVKLEQLVAFAKGDVGTKDQQLKAIEKLNQSIPDYIGHLTLSNIKTEEGARILSAYVGELEKQATAELLIKRIAEFNVKKIEEANAAKKKVQDLNLKILDTELQIATIRKRNEGRVPNASDEAELSALGALKIDLKKKLKERTEEIVKDFSKSRKAIIKEQKEFTDELRKNSTAIDFFGGETKGKEAPKAAKAAKEIAVKEVDLKPAKVNLKTDPNTSFITLPIKASANLDGAKKPVQELAETFDYLGEGLSIMNGAFSQIFNTIASGGENVLQSIVGILGQVVKKLITAAATAAALAAVISLISGGSGAAASGLLTKGFFSGGGAFFKNFLKLFGGGFAQGGISQGPQNGYLQLLHGTEYIMRPDQFNNLIKNVQGRSDSGGMLEARVSGNDLVFVMNRAVNMRANRY